MKINNQILSFAFFLFLLFCSFTEVPAKNYDIKTYKDIPYITGKEAHPKEKLDVYYPDGVSNAPVLFFIHGGAWKQGDKSRYQQLGRHFAKNGIVTVVISYRLSPEFKHPDHINDVASAFAWTHKTIGKYGGDPKKIFVSGHSAGGHLAALLTLDEKYLKKQGLSSKDIRGTIPVSGIYLVGRLNLPGGGKTGNASLDKMNTMFTDAFGEDKTKWEEASPIKYARGDIPPMLILYGEKEPKYMKVQGDLLKKKLNEEGASVELKVLKGEGHLSEMANVGSRKDRLSPEIIEFMKANAGGQR